MTGDVMTVYISKDDGDALVHYGVLGMKWGVRKDRRSDKPSRKQRKAEKQFKKNFRKNWYKSYNEATDKMNVELKRLNEKYRSDDFSKIDPSLGLDQGPGVSKETVRRWNKYVTEAGKTWTKLYSDQLLSDFGEHPTLGKEWVDKAPTMQMYSYYILE